ncbi:hypothetical protein O6H91_17G067400 [Diphasiastrum complanatum]|uniref:Uncharacterized protein n=1 Tax=Diphasiastrum complanatum TaxID=34168 RepID=A0ACC2B7P1_DIPCM|nr:hypothetical protein O6H91_Y324900 [Diphasiastrum complanatum]KAJ7525801.1 hypothetical protein O6H91_17G067400 [Diphasiastrum complanatum]
MKNSFSDQPRTHPIHPSSFVVDRSIALLSSIGVSISMSAAAAGAVVPRRLQGKVAVITASTQGIGYGIALRLGKEGASVVISSRKQKNVDEAVEKLKALGIDAIGIPCHVSIAEQRKRLIQSTVDKYGQIDILVSNAASNPSVDPITVMSEAALDKLWEVNVKAGVLIVQEAAPHLSEGSSIVFISSVGAYNLQGGIAMYGVTKTALLALTKGLAAELAPKVRVNCVAPGFVPTHFARFLSEDESIVCYPCCLLNVSLKGTLEVALT